MPDQHERCPKCGRLFTRPSFYEPCLLQHKSPSAAEHLVNDIEKELSDRRGIGWDTLPDELQDEVRDTLVEIVGNHKLRLKEE